METLAADGHLALRTYIGGRNGVKRGAMDETPPATDGPRKAPVARHCIATFF